MKALEILKTICKESKEIDDMGLACDYDLKELYEAIAELEALQSTHEAQLKAKDESLKLAMDLSEHMLIELKTERYIKEYLAKELKAKDEEIERLKAELDNIGRKLFMI